MPVHRDQQQQQNQQHNTAVAVDMNASRAAALLALGYQPQPPQHQAQQQQPQLQPKQAPQEDATTDTDEKRGSESPTAASAWGEMMTTAATTAPKRAAPWVELDLEQRWNAMFSRLVRYRAAHGHCNVPNSGFLGSGNDELIRLGQWVSRQRRNYRMVEEGKRCSLTPERIRLLEEQGFSWFIIEKRWNDMFSRLVSYKAAHGHCDVPTRGTIGSGNDKLVRLGNWVRIQRKNYRMVTKGKRCSLTPEKIRLLEEQGFSWSIGTGRWQRKTSGAVNAGGATAERQTTPQIEKIPARGTEMAELSPGTGAGCSELDEAVQNTGNVKLS